MSDIVLSRVKSDFASSRDFQQTIETLKHGESVLWDGCVGSSYALIGGLAASEMNRTMLVVVSKVGDVERAANDLAFFTDSPILTYPVLPFGSIKSADEVFLSEDADFGKRLRVLKTLDERSSEDFKSSDVEKAPIIVASLAAILQSVPSREQIVDDSITLKRGDSFGRDKLTRWLSEGKYTLLPAVELSGEYSVRGDIVDVFAVDWERPVRVEFFGDEIDSIREFDVVDQCSTNELESVEISRLRTQGVFDSKFVERLPNDTVVLLVNTDLIVSETTRLLADRGEDRENSTRSGVLVSETMNALYRRPTLHAVEIASGCEFASLSISADFFSVERLQSDFAHVERAFKELEPREKVFVACVTEAEGQRLEATFRNIRYDLGDRMAFPLGMLSGGFEWRERSTLFIGSDQLFGRTISHVGRKRVAKKKEALRKTIDSFMELACGDYVIHEDYGIARYLGVEAKKMPNQTEDHLELEFAKGVHVFVPASQIGKIQRYAGAGGRRVKLATYKGKAWNAKKAEVRKAVWQYAEEMLKVQAARDTFEGVAFPPDDELQQMVESLFPYRETEDQLTAIAAIKKDMEKPRPMDRLPCGDVGFGKTEVALRAAFKAAVNGYQVAILAPTTVLVEQHAQTFAERLATFDIKIKSLSRYTSKQEQKDILAALAEKNKIDIVIGTHRLLSKDVVFNNLGLIIIVEEQKFGVEHKERLKQLRNAVDILTMTATPIPRTLHFSLLGIRDISNLETPPEDRLPVETKVLRFNEEVIRSAILRELNRGGQVYFLHNRVSDIEEMANTLRSIVPEARVRVAHAQTSAEELESTMHDFVRRQFDVLVCTTIVESGIDIPNANTMFVNRANCFGLAELHQLRGRVGREKKQAYCYLLLEQGRVFSTQATQRLKAIQEYDKLGSGFQIAMRDLEIRGAGNILGTEQSGHLEAIGYEMYCDMLEAAVRFIKNEPQKIRIAVEIDLPVTALFDSKYIPDSASKIDFYRRFDRVSVIEEAETLRTELNDRFGKLPPEAERIYVLSKIRVHAFEYRVKRIQMVKIDGLLQSKLLKIEFRDSVRKLELFNLLRQRGVDMRLVDGEMNGYVEIPRDLFDVHGNARADELLEFVMKLFVFSSVEKGEPIARMIEEQTKGQIRPKGKSGAKKSSAGDSAASAKEKRGADMTLRAKLAQYKKQDKKTS